MVALAITVSAGMFESSGFCDINRHSGILPVFPAPFGAGFFSGAR